MYRSACTLSTRRYYPDVVANLSNDDLASHYLSKGRGSSYVAERLRVVATYGFEWPGPVKKYGGLCNQWYIHISIMAVLLQMGAEVVSTASARLKPTPLTSNI